MPLIILMISLCVFSFPAVTFALNSIDQTTSNFLSENNQSVGKISRSRDEVIRERLECAASLQAKGLDWVELCYSSQAESPSRKRQEIIDRALDSAAASLKESQERDEFVSNGTVSFNQPSPEGPAEYSDLTREQYDNQEFDQSDQTLSENPPSKTSEQPAASGVPDLEIEKHHFELGPEFFSYHYREPDLTVEIKGMMYGLYGLYEFRPDKESEIISEVINMYKLEARFSYGGVDYSSDPSGTSKDIDDYAVELRGAAGYDFLIDPRNLITPYAGLGFRYLYDGGGGTVTSKASLGYDRVSHYLYLPIGLDLLNQLNSDWKLGANFEADFLLWGRQDSYLSDASSSYADLRNRQRRGFGLRGSLKLIKKTETVNFLVEPFFRYWHIANSDLTTAVGPTGLAVTGLEPDNRTLEGGVKLGIQY